MESLDEEGMQLHQTQLRLVRDQTGVLSKDLGALRREVAALRKHGPKDAPQRADLDALRAELQALRAALEGGVRQVAGEVRVAHRRLEEVQNQASAQHGDWEAESQELRRLLGAERSAREALHGAVQESVQRHLAYEKVGRELRHASTQERLGHLEGALGLPPAEEQAREAAPEAQARGKADKLAAARGARRCSLVDRLQALEEARKAEPSLAERLSALEHTVGGAINQQAKALEDARAVLDQLHARISECEASGGGLCEAKVRALLAEERASLDARHAWSKERVDRLEDHLGASTQELEALGEGCAKRTADIEAHSVALGQRLGCLEKAFNDSADTHNQELDATLKRFDHMCSRISDHHNQLAFHASAHNRLSHLERVLRSYLEGVLGEEARGAGHGKHHLSHAAAACKKLESCAQEGADDAKRPTGDLACSQAEKQEPDLMPTRRGCPILCTTGGP